MRALKLHDALGALIDWWAAEGEAARHPRERW
jgi:hypothetical protein